MLYNHSFFFKNIYLCLLSIWFMNTFLFQYNCFHFYLESLARLNCNDYDYFNFFFFWTNIWYMSKFFLLITCLTLTLWLSFYKIYSFIYYITVSVGLMSYFSLLSTLNFFIEDTFYQSVKINWFLSNKVNKLHPPLFYLNFIYFFYIFLPNPFYIKFEWGFLRKDFTLLGFFLLTILLTTLFMGSWWALQEGSWGGWWNWDMSELLGIFFLFKIFTIWHLSFRLPSHEKTRNILYLLLYFILIFYICLQINFASIAHNFGFRKGIFFFEKINYLLITISVTMVYSYYYNHFIHFRQYTSSHTFLPGLFFFTFYFYLRFIFFLSLYSLMAYDTFIPTLYSLHFFTTILFILFFFCFTVFTFFSYHFFFTRLLFIFDMGIITLTTLYSRRLQISSVIHVFILLSFLIFNFNNFKLYATVFFIKNLYIYVPTQSMQFQFPLIEYFCYYEILQPVFFGKFFFLHFTRNVLYEYFQFLLLKGHFFLAIADFSFYLLSLFYFTYSVLVLLLYLFNRVQLTSVR
jgi:hypothetical protein